MRFFLIVTLTVGAIAFSNGASSGTFSLTNLLGAEDLNLVPAHLNAFQASNSDILGQLKSLLSNEPFVSQLYARYQAIFKNSEGNEVTFGQTLFKIAEHNIEYEAQRSTFQMGVNQFTSLTEEELMRRHTGLVVDNSTSLESDNSMTFVKAPATLDWRSRNIVTPVKNQESCGSCVTFGTAAIVESAYAKAKGTKLDLSEQELLDCTPENNGCNGGWYTYSLKQVQQSGLASEATYPYKSEQGSCARSGKARAIQSTEVKSQGSCSTSGNESSLKDKVATYGPVAIAVGVSNDWYYYKSGIYTKSCASGVNHALVIVGYGTDHWIIKNSWDTTWGESGFMKLQYGVNKCSVANHCFYVQA